MPQSQPRKVTVNLDAGLHKDATEMLEPLGHDSMSALISTALEEYIVAHSMRLHSQWREANGLNTSEALATEESLITEVVHS
ncbi:hypothetical protein [Nonomuraea endophytica]|uniref:CopG family transcriptional regulator n=1 Tax=Nonomuraea endophytica TaxID=714136 RepID=A0A7W8ADB2_9ACTN|nr:hypothetical protein [Nonomuraea endophytica]MBB5084013.1 hypothetical protein [Nonomuraea endophytica]